MPANRYVWITLAGACLISWIYFGDIWLSPNQYVFTSSGDGLQGYYQTAWHVRYDSAAWHQHSLNYPFGESIFFTGGQPLLSNSARCLDLKDCTVGISNVFLLSSGILATLFVFLIFMRLGVTGYFASACSIGIVMLSQQWERFSGHFALSVMWAIPLLLWLFMRYFDALKQRARSSWFNAMPLIVILFLLGLIQFYYLFFALVLLAGFVLAYGLRSGIQHKLQFFAQLIVMVVVPIVSLQVLMHASSDVTDRTAVPWGFLVYRSSLWSYVYPFGMPYESWFAFLKPDVPLEWEGLAFIGLSTGIALIVALLIVVKRRTYRSATDFFPSAMLAFSIAGMLCVLVSLAFPFNIGFENLLYKLGVIQQFRGIGRFAFVAYYPITIVSFTLLLRQTNVSRWLHMATIALCALLIFEGHSRMHLVSTRISNQLSNLFSNGAVELRGIDASKYQAIHPLPYMHIGSENIGFSGSDAAMQHLLNTSFTLGIPSTAAIMSRTSLSQTFLSCGMAWELMEEPAILQRFPDQRPLLVLADRSHLGINEQQLLQFADSITGNEQFTYYALPLSAFASVVQRNAERANTLAQQCLYGPEYLRCSDSLRQVIWDDTSYVVRFSKDWKKLFERPVAADWQRDTLKISFWVSDFSRDLVPRTVTEFIQFDRAHNVVDYQTEFMGKRLIGMKDKDALIEYTLHVQPQTTSISMAIENKVIQGTDLQINSLLMRPQEVNCRIFRNEIESLNNRIFSR